MLRRHPLFQGILARGERSGATIFWKHRDAGKPQDLSVQGAHASATAAASGACLGMTDGVHIKVAPKTARNCWRFRGRI
jgi:hypothetical protein